MHTNDDVVLLQPLPAGCAHSRYTHRVSGCVCHFEMHKLVHRCLGRIVLAIAFLAEVCYTMILLRCSSLCPHVAETMLLATACE